MLVLVVVLAVVLLLVIALAAGMGGGFGAGAPTVYRRVHIRRPARRVIVEEQPVTRRVYEDDRPPL